jgi:hypothetical protein
LAALLVFRWLVLAAANQDRLMLPVLAPVFLLLWDGCMLLKRWVSPVKALAAIVVVMTAWSFSQTTLKRVHGIQDVAGILDAREDLRDAVLFVCSDGSSEGAFIAEVAVRDEHRPARYILRSSKVMASSLWTGYRYRARTRTTEDVMKLIRDAAIGVVVIDLRPAVPVEHMRVLRQAVEEHPAEFKPIAIPGGRFLAYEVAGHRERPRPKFSMFLAGLGKDVKQE